jgi:hypothetical protein
MEKVLVHFRRILAVSNLNSLSIYILSKTEISDEEYLQAIKEFSNNWQLDEDDTLFFGKKEVPDQKEAFIVKIAFNYKEHL